MGADIADGTGVGTILANDAPPELSIDDVLVNEGDGTATFTVSLSEASTNSVSVDYNTTDGTAIAGSDYSPASGTLTFAAGEISKTVSVSIIDDVDSEPNETFEVHLSNNLGADIADGTGVGTISGNDAPSNLSINDVTVNEGDGIATFTVSLSSVSSGTVSVDYSTADGSAIIGSDYTATSGTLTFMPGTLTQAFTVDIQDDSDIEGNEAFNISLSNVIGPATITDGVAVGTIVDNDSTSGPELLIDDISVNENAGTATFTVSLSSSGTSPITVDFATVDDTATTSAKFLPAIDYQSTSGSLTFAANTTELTQSITVNINDDFGIEGDETFNIELSNANGATIADGTGIGTIIEDDGTNLSSSLLSYNFSDTAQQALSYLIFPTDGSPSLGVTITAEEEGVAKDVSLSPIGLGVAGEADPNDPFNREIDGKGPGGANDGSGGFEELNLLFPQTVKLEVIDFNSANNDDDFTIAADGVQFISAPGITSPKRLPLDLSSFNAVGTEFTFSVVSNTGSDDYVLNAIQVSLV